MSKEKGSGIGKFIAGAMVGAGLGVLFAPKKGSETRDELKEKTDEVIKQIKDIDKEQVKEDFLLRVEEIKDELKDLDREKALKIAKEKALDIKDKTQDLVDMAVEKGTPLLKNATEQLRLKAIDVTKEVLIKLEDSSVK